MKTWAEIVFWISAAGLFYIYIGYPMLIWLLARIRPRPVRKGDPVGPCSVVIAAYNEAENLSRKLANILSSKQGHWIAEIIVGSDGSTDGTVEVAEAVEDSRIRVVSFAERRGKPAVLNDLIPQCASDIVVLTDARQELDPIAIGALLENFADPDVGVVSGELVFRRQNADSTAASGMDAYWRYEKWIRRNEARFGSVPGATGALYAIRKSLFGPIRAETLIDDVVIPLSIVAQGFRCVFDEDAIVYDMPSKTVQQESIRKRRTIAGNAQLLRLYPRWIFPWGNPAWFQVDSHKLARLFSPLLLILALTSSLVLSNQGSYMAFAVLQTIFYLCVSIGWVVSKAGLRCRMLSVPMMFVAMNAITLFALSDAICSHFDPAWRRGDADSSQASHGAQL